MGGGARCRDKEASKQEDQVWGRKMMTLFDSDRRAEKLCLCTWCPEISSYHGADGTRQWTLETEGSVGHGKGGSKPTLLNLCANRRGHREGELQEEASQGGHFLL